MGNLIFASNGTAQPLHWKITPTTCVVDQQGSSCALDLKIKQASIEDKICLFVGAKQIQCWIPKNEFRFMQIDLHRTETLMLKTTDDKLIYETLVRVKSLTPVNYRRRVRNPWSIF